MQRLRLKTSVPTWLGLMPAGLVLCFALGTSSVSAQVANDDWANAQELTGVWASVTNDNTGATAQPGEPSHAGFPATNSIWYKWLAPSDGEVTLDTLGSG